ncbi:hypothetical protein HDV06_003054, partial [Boothiomyces sp. JEL0866]
LMQPTYYKPRILAVLSMAVVYMVCIFNISVLKAFSVLNENITEKRLLVWFIIITALYLVSSVGGAGLLFCGEIPPDIWAKLNLFGTIAFSAFGIVYDNFQTVYIIYLVSKIKKNAIADKQFKSFYHLLFSFILISVIDWCGLVLYCIGVFAKSNSIPNLTSLVECIICIHGLMMIEVFRRLKKFTFSTIGKKRKVIRDTSQQTKQVMELK